MFGRLPQPCQPSLAERAGTACRQTAFYLATDRAGFPPPPPERTAMFWLCPPAFPLGWPLPLYPTSPAPLAVAKGGTGQTSFGQGWLNSDGTTLSASTSPTVNYLTATSTTASTFPYASTTALTVSGSAYIGSLNGPLQANGGLVSATTSVGYQYGGTGLTAAPSFGQILERNRVRLFPCRHIHFRHKYDGLDRRFQSLWTNDRFDSRLSATTTLPNLTTLLGLTNATSTALTVTNLYPTNLNSTTLQGRHCRQF